MKTKPKSKPAPEEPKIEIINAVVSDVRLYYAYDMPNHVDVFFKRANGSYEENHFAAFHYGFNENHDQLYSKELNFGITMSNLLKVFYRNIFQFSDVIGTFMRIKIRRIKQDNGGELIDVLAISHITTDTWLAGI